MSLVAADTSAPQPFREAISKRYTPEQADRIQGGLDPTTQADITRWNSLGRRSAA